MPLYMLSIYPRLISSGRSFGSCINLGTQINLRNGKPEHLRRGVLLLSRSPGPYLHRSIQVHGSMSVARITWSEYPKEGTTSERKSGRRRGRGDECTGTSKDQVHPREPGKRKLRRMKTSADATKPRAGPPHRRPYMNKAHPVHVADFVCSRVRRVGALERRRFGSFSSQVTESTSRGKFQLLPNVKISYIHLYAYLYMCILILFYFNKFRI